MIKKENKLVITFRTTTMAMAMERCCKEQGIPGRLIPVPTSISAGCGLAWCTKPEEEENICAFMAQNEITPEAIQVCYL